MLFSGRNVVKVLLSCCLTSRIVCCHRCGKVSFSHLQDTRANFTPIILDIPDGPYSTSTGAKTSFVRASNTQIAAEQGHPALKQQERTRRPALITIDDDASSSQIGSAAAVLPVGGSQYLVLGTGGGRKRRDEGRLDKENDTDIQFLGSSNRISDGIRGQPERKKKAVDRSGFATKANPLPATNGGLAVSRSTGVAAAAHIAPNPTMPGWLSGANRSQAPRPAVAAQGSPPADQGDPGVRLLRQGRGLVYQLR